MRGIVEDPEIRGGKPVLAGTRLQVSTIGYEFDELGKSADAIVAAHPHLSLADVHRALAYYYEHIEAMQEEHAAGEDRLESIKQDTSLPA